MENILFANWLIAFVAVAVLDLAWAAYTASVAQGSSPARAGGWAVLLYWLGAVATIGYTKDPWLLVPSCAGAFVGTYVGVWWNRRKRG